MNMFKKNGGFTLVELIVVIAILAILAGVAIPAYSGYIEKAKDAAVITELDAIQTAAQAANATAGEITGITLDSDGKTVNVTAKDYISNKFVADFNLFYGGTGTETTGTATKTIAITLTETVTLTGTSYANGATWSATGWAATPKSGS